MPVSSGSPSDDGQPPLCSPQSAPGRGCDQGEGGGANLSSPALVPSDTHTRDWKPHPHPLTAMDRGLPTNHTYYEQVQLKILVVNAGLHPLTAMDRGLPTNHTYYEQVQLKILVVNAGLGLSVPRRGLQLEDHTFGCHQGVAMAL